MPGRSLRGGAAGPFEPIASLRSPFDVTTVSHSSTPALPVRRQDRVIDAAAALCLTGGVALFALGRNALSAIAGGTYPAPLGETWVARADFHVAQTRLGVVLVAIGVGVACLSALRHALHRRASSR
jgi:hypothetical protein